MKMIKNLIITATIIVCSTISALAQFDNYMANKTALVTSPSILTESGVVNVTTTNIIPIRVFEGLCQMDFMVTSNSATGTASFAIAINGGNTGTNGWTALTNVALSTSASVIFTNFWGTTNSSVAYYTNSWLVPGTISNAQVYAQGFAGQYTIPAQFTNTASFTMTAGGVTSIGFNANDEPQYLQIIYTTGTNATYTVSGALHGRTKYGQY